jgi:mannose-6-phosphate isomerase-like protein (cupin superfamily)
VIVDGNGVDVEPGMVICGPSKSTYQIVNTSKEVLHAYIVFGPAGPEESLLKAMGKT